MLCSFHPPNGHAQNKYAKTERVQYEEGAVCLRMIPVPKSVQDLCDLCSIYVTHGVKTLQSRVLYKPDAKKKGLVIKGRSARG